MDVKKVFDNLRPWSRGLDVHLSGVLGDLMATEHTGGFAEIPAADIRRLQEQLIRSGDDPERQMEMKRATHNLEPAVSDACFI